MTKELTSITKVACIFVWHFKEIKRIQKNEDDFISNVLLWAIFANRIELAEMFWLKGTNHLCKIRCLCKFFLKKINHDFIVHCKFGF